MEQASDSRRNPSVGITVSFHNAVTQFRRVDETGVMSLAVFTALVGLIIALVHLDPLTAPNAILAIAAAAGAVGVPNMWRDADIDAPMTRPAAPNPAHHFPSRSARYRTRLGWGWPPFLVLPPLSGQQHLSP
jgi:heme O synthase-like polyprenyltransferase